jgi:hypothetical protein
MTDLFGARWLETYGPEPSPLWANQVEALNDAQVKRALQMILKTGSGHPPSLPEFLAFARGERSVEAPASPEAPREEITVGRWFIYRSVRFRFVGMTLGDHQRLRERALWIARAHFVLAQDNDPAATHERLLRLLDEAAEEIYPAKHAEAWLANPAALEWLVENLPKTAGAETHLRYGRSTHQAPQQAVA